MIAVGAGAVNQTVKAIAIAAGFGAPQGYVISNRVSFMDLEIAGEKKTGMRFLIITD
jgi:stage V sporulation protein S